MSKKSKVKSVAVAGEYGSPCHRCGEVTQVRTHKEIGERQLLRQPFYYRRWYLCVNPKCPTTMIMPEEHQVWNDNAAAQELRAKMPAPAVAKASDVETRSAALGRLTG
jgi:hypothetical protein